jgi:acyl-CoA dehydrogenase
MSEISEQFDRMLAGQFTPARVRAIDAGDPWNAEHAEIEASGFLDALGSGLPLSDVVPLWSALGRHAAPLAIGEAMIERGALAGEARALLFAAAMSGASDRVLEMTVVYAGERSQFGSPIGRQQAVQQQIAVMAEECVAVRLAVALAAEGEFDPLRVACAKAIASAAASRIANTAHAVHGAIGISAEYDLQLYTRRLHAWRLEEGAESHWHRKLGQAMLNSQNDALGFVRGALFGE